jgi:hypothetical protein
MLISEFEYGFKADTAVEMAVQFNQRQCAINHSLSSL